MLRIINKYVYTFRILCGTLCTGLMFSASEKIVYIAWIPHNRLNKISLKLLLLLLYTKIYIHTGLPTKDETAKTVRSEIRCVCVYPLLDFYKVLKLI